MPTYEYVCESCGHRFENFQSMTSKSLKKCPKCGALSLNRLIGAGAGLIFKGSGFYQTDYRSDSYKKAQTSEGSATAAKPESSSTDTKKSAPKKPSKK